MTGFKILYLDENSFLASQIKMRLEWKGYQVVISESEQNFLIQLNQQSFDLLIIDQFTPQPNAISLLQSIKGHKLKLQPTILVAEKAESDIVIKAMHIGCLDYVVKNSLVQKFYDQISVSIFQVFEKLQQQQLTAQHASKSQSDFSAKIKKNISESLINWKYSMVEDRVQWIPFENSEKISLTYDGFCNKIHLEDLARVKTQNNICLFSQEPVEYTFRFLFRQNRVVTYQAKIKAEVDQSGVVKQLYGYFKVLSTQQLTDKSLRLKLSFLENTSDAVFITDAQKRIISVNRSFMKLSGYSEQDVYLQDSSILNLNEFDDDFFADVAEQLRLNDIWMGEVSIRHHSGEEIKVSESIYILKDKRGGIAQSISVLRDITQQKSLEETIKFQANYDPLTQLPNRSLFQDRLANAMRVSKRKGNKLALMILDLNKFKWINDTMGHHAGDILLQETANKLQMAVRNTDTVARLGGDEFSIILPELEKATDSEIIISKIFEAFSESIFIEKQEVFISGSIGVTIFPDDAIDIHSLQKNADSAMYMAKNNGFNYYYYTRELQQKTETRLKLISDMHSALKNNEFSLHYQPIIDVVSNKISCAETLLRWKHKTQGYVPLDDFIPVAEDSGLIHEIGNWVINEVAEDLNRWSTLKLSPIQISLNQSIAQYRLAECHSEWLDILKNKQIAPEKITFEISENIFLEDKYNYLDSIAKLKQEGVQISLDGFGTGYSSLSYLTKIPIDVIKIDRSYINEMVVDRSIAVLVETIIVLANKLGIKVIATGVENKKQMAFLSRKCRYLQGYYYSKPLPIEEFEQYIKVYNRA